MTKLRDKVVAVTGAGSGIGRALAERLAALGAHLALSDIDGRTLRETAGLISGVNVSTHVVDVRSRDAVERYAADARAKHGGVDVIVNNAGRTVFGSLEEVPYEDFAMVLDINLWGVVYGTRAFLPLLRERPEGHVVNISSINAMVPFAMNGPYNMSKYAVLGFSETLELELRGQPIRVTCVHPGGIQTNIVHNAKNMKEAQATAFGRVAKTTAPAAAAAIARAIEKNKRQAFIGIDAKTMALCKRIAPRTTLRATDSFMKTFGLK
jgi:NAD(P)-dependent dehydrogenase (short-subunit alcohol dehydrogenase family)